MAATSEDSHYQIHSLMIALKMQQPSFKEKCINSQEEVEKSGKTNYRIWCRLPRTMKGPFQSLAVHHNEWTEREMSVGGWEKALLAAQP